MFVYIIHRDGKPKIWKGKVTSVKKPLRFNSTWMIFSVDKKSNDRYSYSKQNSTKKAKSVIVSSMFRCSFVSLMFNFWFDFWWSDFWFDCCFNFWLIFVKFFHY